MAGKRLHVPVGRHARPSTSGASHQSGFTNLAAREEVALRVDIHPMLLMPDSVVPAQPAPNPAEKLVQVVAQPQLLPHHCRTFPGQSSQQVRAAPLTTRPKPHIRIHFTGPMAVDATITRHTSALAFIGGMPQDAVGAGRMPIPFQNNPSLFGTRVQARPVVGADRRIRTLFHRRRLRDRQATLPDRGSERPIASQWLVL